VLSQVKEMPVVVETTSTRPIRELSDRSDKGVDRRLLWIAFLVAAIVALPLSFIGGVRLKRYFSHPTPLVEPFSDPNDAFRFGDQALKEGRYEVAIVALSRAVELDDSNSEAHHRLADALLSDGRIDEAKAHYRRYLELDPNAPDAQRIREVVDTP
jgi:tetratricopeptide (TPR) repeat protein